MVVRFPIEFSNSRFGRQHRHQLNFTKIGSMRWRAADGIADGDVDRQVEIRAVRIEKIGPAGSQFIASLPPAMLADDNPWIEFFAETRLGSHFARGGAHVNPI